MLFLTEFSHVNPLPYYIDFLLNVLDFSGIRLSMDYCCAEGAGGDSYYISPRTGNCVSREVGEKYKQRLFLIPKSFKSYSEDIEDISSAIDIAHYFLRRTFAENCTAQKNRMIDIFREILLQEIKRQGSMNTGNCQPYGPRTRQTRSDTRS
jgi:DNA repair protein RecO (recombination protein O)